MPSYPELAAHDFLRGHPGFSCPADLVAAGQGTLLDWCLALAARREQFERIRSSEGRRLKSERVTSRAHLPVLASLEALAASTAELRALTGQRQSTLDHALRRLEAARYIEDRDGVWFITLRGLQELAFLREKQACAGSRVSAPPERLLKVAA
jgi:hypothetical protein